MVASEERRVWWLRDYWLHLVLLTLAGAGAVARLTGVVGTWWWVIAPVAAVGLLYLATYVVLRVDHARRSGKASGS